VELPKKTLLVTENFQSQVLSLNDLSQYSNCKFSKIYEKLIIPIPKDILYLFSPSKNSTIATALSSSSSSALASGGSFDLEKVFLQLILNYLKPIYSTTEWSSSSSASSLSVEKLVVLSCVVPTASSFATSTGTTIRGNDTKSIVASEYSSLLATTGLPKVITGISIQWNASSVSDTIADSVAGLLLQFFAINNLIRMNLDTLLSQAIKLVGTGAGTTASVTTNP
jgi:hypothetical protein